VRKLNEEVMEKTIAIEGLSRELNRERRKLEERERELAREIGEVR
jgi:hypothetical protein